MPNDQKPPEPTVPTTPQSTANSQDKAATDATPSTTNDLPATNNQPQATLPADMFPEQRPLKKFLRLKLSLFTITQTVLIALFAYLAIFYFHLTSTNLVIATTLFSFILGIVSVAILWLSFRPLERIFTRLEELIHGKDSPAQVKTMDEFEDIDQAITKALAKLHLNLVQTSSAKEESESENLKLTNVLSALVDGILVLDKNRNIYLANKPAEKIVGWSLPEMKGQPIDQILNLTESTNQAITSNDYCPVSMGGTAQGSYNIGRPLKLMSRAGSQAIVNLISSEILNSASLGCLVILRDAGKQRELEDMQLDFVSMASHELRTPLTSIKGYLSVFMNENKDKFNKEQQEFLGRIMVSTQQLGTLIENLLNVSKVERGAIAVNAQALDWEKVLEQAVSESQLQAGEKNIVLSFAKPMGRLPQVKADPVRINEVLNNLINNAINYTQEGGKVTVSAAIQGDQVITSITDNGRGIAPDALAHLFTKFFRIQGALDKSSNSKGTGLGLYLSKSIVEMHHGKIWAASPGLGKGTSFSFSLPISKQNPLQANLTSLDISQFTLK